MRFADFGAVYDEEVERLKAIAADREAAGGGGTFLLNQPYRIGERLSHALIDDALNGRTSLNKAIRLMSLKSLTNFDKYAQYLSGADA